MNAERITNRVIERIAERRMARARAWASLHGLLCIFALAAIVPAYQYLAGSAASSGFSTYLSLLGSDGSTLMRSWQAFGLTLVESAPIAGFALVLGILLVLVYGARKTAADWGRMRVGVARA